MDRINSISKRFNSNIKKSVVLIKEKSSKDNEEIDYLELKDIFEHNKDSKNKTK